MEYKKCTHKTCKVCQETKERKHFTNGAKNKTMRTCRECRSAIIKKHRQEHNVEQRKKDRALYKKYQANRIKCAHRYRKKYPEKIREATLKKYGMTLDQYNEKLKLQDNKCAICNIDMNTYGKNLMVDHNHTTGKIRDLLCHPCNSGVGFYEKNHNRYVAYLNKYNF